MTKVGHIIEAPYYDRNGNFFEKLEDEDNDITDNDNLDNIDDSNSDDD